MRPVTKVLLVLAVIILAVGVVWFVSYRWGKTEPPARNSEAQKPPEPTYNDPLATYQRWRARLPGASGQPPADSPARRQADRQSSSVNEGAPVARRSDTPVAGADPPGPALRPTGVEGQVVTQGWRARDPAAGSVYTIVAGDTLYGIAMKHYGDPRCAGLIETANPGLSAHALRVGEKILLPEKPAPSAGPAPAGPASTAQGRVYVVQKNDTLIGISKRMYGDATMYRKIYEANKDVLSSANATLHVGQKLRLPEQ
ncbi:MAG: LysM peptidoglycan-binding domain-containing protein [Planctomycetes bacterium]|nr:LysM peptidoglycan-binding domain-containing protein [Planctomycetota bacterium]